VSTVIIRNGDKLCAKCRDKGCNSYWPAGSRKDTETEYVSDEPCTCCELDFDVDDGFGA
jgi:hypothetical protein